MVKRLALGAGGLVFFALLVILVSWLHFDRSRDELAKSYASASSQFIDLDGARVHMRDEGNPDGPVLVLLHGSNASLHTWEPWVAELGGRFRIVSVDLPGHGLTGRVPGDDYSRAGMVEFLHKFVKARGLAHFALAGNSMGGAVAVAYAEEHGDDLAALVLLNAAGLPRDPGEKPLLAFRLLRMPLAGSAMRWFTPRSLVARTVRESFADPSKVDDAMIDRYLELMLHEGNRAATIKRFSVVEDDAALAAGLSRISVPTLILWGTEDRLVPLAQARVFEAGITGSRLIVYEHVGHMPMEEVPAQSANDARIFLESVFAAASVYGELSTEEGSLPGQRTVPSLNGKGAVEVAPLGAD